MRILKSNYLRKEVLIMDEKELFNRDTMFWREVNITSPNTTAKIELNAPVEINGEWVSQFECFILPFVSHDIEYPMDNGGSFKKNEVRSWPYVLLNNLDNYQLTSSDEFIHQLDHDHVESIELVDKNDTTLLKKSKI